MNDFVKVLKAVGADNVSRHEGQITTGEVISEASRYEVISKTVQLRHLLKRYHKIVLNVSNNSLSQN